jgi:hypothetical protein
MASLADLEVNVSANLANLYRGLEAGVSAVSGAADRMSGAFEGITSKVDGVSGAISKLAAVAGIGLSFGFVKELVSSTIEAQASLADLGLKAGITAEQLSSLNPAARLSGTSLEAVALAAGKFSKTLVEIEAGTGKGVAAFKALGFSAADATRFLKDPAQGLQELAVAASKFADDGNKVAAVQLLMGKSAAELLPFLHDLAEQGDLQATVTNAQAAAAKTLQDEWTLLQLRSEKLKTQLVAELVPSLTALVRAYAAVTSEVGGLNQSTQDLIANGQVAAWAQQAGLAIAKFADSLSDGFVDLRKYAEVIGLVITTLLDLARAVGGASLAIATGGAQGFDQVIAAYEDFRKNLAAVKETFNQAPSTKFQDAFVDQLINIQLEAGKTSNAVEAARPSLRGLGKELDDGAVAANKAAAAYAEALAKLAEARSNAGAAVAQQQIKSQLDDERRNLDRGLSDFETYYARRNALQTESLNIEAAALTANLAQQEALQRQFIAEALSLDAGRFKTAGAYQQAYYALVTKATNAEAEAAKIKGQLAITQDKLNQVGKDYIEQLIQQSNGLLKSVDALNKEVESRERANEEIGLTKSQVIALNIARVEEARVNAILAGKGQDVIDFYDAQIDGLRRLGEATAKGEGIQRVIDGFRELDQAAQGVFESLFNKGDDTFKQLGASLKKWFIDLLYQLTVKPILINIAAQVTGVNGGALGGATQPGGLLGLFTQGGGAVSGAGGQGGGGLLNIGGGASGLFNSFATSGAGVALGLGETVGTSAAAAAAGGLSLGVEAGATAATGALSAAGAGIAAAIPVVGWVVAAAALIYSIVQANKVPSPAEGQFAVRAPGTDPNQFEDQAFTDTQFGRIGFADQGTKQFSGEAAQAFNKSIGGLLDLFATRFSKQQTDDFTSAFQTLQFPHFEGTFTTEDFLKKYGDTILKQVATSAFDVLDPALGKVIKGFNGTGDSLTKFIGSLLIFSDVAKRLPTDVAASLEAAIGNTQEGLDKITAFAGAFLSIQDILNANPLDDAFAAIDAGNQTFATKVEVMGTNLIALAANFDGSAASATALATATQNYYNAQVQLLAQLEQVKVAVTDLFSNTIRDITLQTLDNTGKGDFLNAEITDLQNQLYASSDPTQINQLAQRINADINTMFGLLSPEEQRAQLGTFTDNIRTLNDEVVQRLSDVEGAVQDTGQGVLTSIQTAMTDAIAQMTLNAAADAAAAATQQAAADTQLAAANTPQTIVVVTEPVNFEQNG